VPVILSVANQKGGVGKTTTATNLANAFGLAGRSVLVVDVDPQGNATSGMGVEIAAESPGFASSGQGPVVVQTTWRNVACMPAARDLERLATHPHLPQGLLKHNLARLVDRQFDLVLIDCPPSLGHLTRSALAASDAVLIPIQCEYYPLEGLVQLIGAVRYEARKAPLKVAGILLTMYDPEAELTHEVEGEVRGKLEEPVFRTAIPRDTAVAESPSHCLSVIDYAPRSRGAKAYADLALEMLDRGIVT
jgi:chromosome partitioning protein